MTDTLQFESSAAVLADPARYSSSVLVNPAVTSLNGGRENFHDIALQLKMRNLGQSTKSGIDFDVGYRVPGEWGRWFLGMQATYMLTSREKTSANASWVSDLARYSSTGDIVTPRWRTRWMVGLQRADAHLQLNLNYTSGYQDRGVLAYDLATGKTETVDGRKVAGFLTTDMIGSYRLSSSTQLRAGITNLLNARPPQSFYSLTTAVWGANTQNGSLFGRTVQVGITHRF
jgi:outer membrane receptor protein involved in Fe transport